MTFITKIKRAFGFDGEHEEELYPDAPETYTSPRVEDADDIIEGERRHPSQPGRRNVTVPAAVHDDESLAADIFDAVVELFNSQQPDFVSKCLNRPSQREYIYNSLSDALKARIAAQQHCRQAPHAGDREKSLEKERDDARSAQLSAERQKRALNDRVNDLEQRLFAIDAEREQLYLENRSLVERVKNLPAGDATDVRVADFEARIAEKDAAIEALTHECGVYRNDLETLKVKAGMADEMIKDLQSKVAMYSREIDEAHETIDAAARVVGQMEEFEALKNKKDMRIAELKRLVNIKDKEIAELNATLEHNQRRHIEAEQLLRKEIKHLRAGRENAPLGDRNDNTEGRRDRRRDPDSQMSLFN